MSEQTSYPLHWPAGWPRAIRRHDAPFRLSMAAARDDLMRQLDMMGARYPVLSTNVSLRRDGLPYANQPQPADPGVAVFFQWRGKQMTFACDRWSKVEDNVRAIGKTIEALRGIERWGASDMMERAFSAFEALPAPDGVVTLSCWDILGIEPGANELAVRSAYRKQVRTAHPDQGGTREEWDKLQAAYEQALSSVSVKDVA